MPYEEVGLLSRGGKGVAGSKGLPLVDAWIGVICLISCSVDDSGSVGGSILPVSCNPSRSTSRPASLRASSFFSNTNS